MANDKYVSSDNLAYFWLKLKEKLSKKVEVKDGYGLSKNDYTDDDKVKLGNIYNYIENTLKNWIGEIGDLIPEDASAENKLADVDFVNSSISTNTATFQGTYDSESELPTSGVDINDYAFVRAVDDLGNVVYKRYKYKEKWEYEYDLNNSSFTAKQWAAINSEITEDLVKQIGTNKEDISKLSADKADISILKALAYKDSLSKSDVGLGNVDNTSDMSKPVSTAMQNALNLKAEASDVDTLKATTKTHTSNISNINNNMVDKSSTQTIGGDKTFSNGIKLSNNHYSPTDAIEFDGGAQTSPDLNNFTVRGIYHCTGGTNTPSFDHDNSSYDLMIFNSVEEGVNVVTQMAIIGWKWWIRRGQGNTWGAWERFGQSVTIDSLNAEEIDAIFES